LFLIVPPYSWIYFKTCKFVNGLAVFVNCFSSLPASHHCRLAAKGFGYFTDGVKTGISAMGKGFVQAGSGYARCLFKNDSILPVSRILKGAGCRDAKKGRSEKRRMFWDGWQSLLQLDNLEA